MNLKDFRPDISNFDSDQNNLKDADSQISASIYHKEAITLKIDKLSNRITIISIIILCLIVAIIVLGYLDMKKRMFDVDVTKQSQVDKISQQLEEKLNALDIKIAKNKFDLDNNLPEFHKKNISLETLIAKLASSKVDTETINVQLDKLAKQVADNTNQDKTTLQTIEMIKEQILSTLKTNNAQFNTIAQQIKTETDLFKKEFNARLLKLSDDDQQIGELRKNLSLMDKEYKNLESETASQAIVDKQIKQLENDLNNLVNTLDSRIETLNQKLAVNISRLQKDIGWLSNRSPDSTKPKPKINIDPSESHNEAKQEYENALANYNQALEKMDSARNLKSISNFGQPAANKRGGVSALLGLANNAISTGEVQMAERNLKIAEERLQQAKYRLDSF